MHKNKKAMECIIRKSSQGTYPGMKVAEGKFHWPLLHLLPRPAPPPLLEA